MDDKIDDIVNGFAVVGMLAPLTFVAEPTPILEAIGGIIGLGIGWSSSRSLRDERDSHVASSEILQNDIDSIGSVPDAEFMTITITNTGDGASFITAYGEYEESGIFSGAGVLTNEIINPVLDKLFALPDLNITYIS